MKKELFDYIEHNRTAIEETWSVLHSMPETAFLEKRTSAYLAEELRQCGFEVKEGLGGTGVLGILDSGRPGPKIGLRADMDALLHTNETGEDIAMHTCGHDANCTEALWAAKAISAIKPPESGKLFSLFQPAEESLGGALEIIETGVLKDLDYLIGTHLRPAEELPLGKVTPAILHSASAKVEVFVTGEEAHGGRPHQGINAIEAAVGIIQAIQALHLNPAIPHSIKPTKFHSGSNPLNVIPSCVSLCFDLRAQTNEFMALQKERIIKIAEYIGEAYGAKVSCKPHKGAPAATMCPELINITTEAIKDALGENAAIPAQTTSGGEDFHEYAVAIPDLKSTIIGVGADLTPGLHKISMKFDREAIIHGIKVLSLTACRLFDKNII
ncbi:MAG: amidohydrolase [Synergistaceae bacterium]|nr:amidohydrolase [Synergistaceae bacterium]